MNRRVRLDVGTFRVRPCSCRIFNTETGLGRASVKNVVRCWDELMACTMLGQSGGPLLSYSSWRTSRYYAYLFYITEVCPCALNVSRINFLDVFGHSARTTTSWKILSLFRIVGNIQRLHAVVLNRTSTFIIISITFSYSKLIPRNGVMVQSDKHFPPVGVTADCIP